MYRVTEEGKEHISKIKGAMKVLADELDVEWDDFAERLGLDESLMWSKALVEEQEGEFSEEDIEEMGFVMDVDTIIHELLEQDIIEEV